MSLRSDTILIVDDEKIVRKLLTSGLSSAGYTCIEAANAEEAQKTLQNYTAGIILMDITMPGKSGIELLREVMVIYPDIAVIMISALSSSEIAIECMRLGAYDYISKPFNMHEVLLRIENALQKRKLILDNNDYRKRLEEIVGQQAGEIRASEENFRNSLENSPLGIRIVTEEGRTIYANHALLDIYGYSSMEELDSLPYENRHTPETNVAHQERVRKRQSGESVALRYEIDIVGKNGEIRRLLVNRAEVLWNGERQFQVLYQDITERVQAEKALQASYDKLDKMLDAVIQTMALTVEMRDPYTAGHQNRVARLASAIAGEMGLAPEKLKGLFVIGAIHDIGKISVPSEILSKPGRITESEFSIIKEHPKTGYDILKGIDFPWPVAQAVLQHHERMNGAGYPGRLSGENIIIEARILAVADVVEAMASHRPYRPSLGIDKALEEISLKKGILYDAVAAEACLKLFREKKFSFDSEIQGAI
jgi:PAS domain S-box-containing protein/putative nucleotidyltransferase with HDIG domain